MSKVKLKLRLKSANEGENRKNNSKKSRAPQHSSMRILSTPIFHVGSKSADPYLCILTVLAIFSFSFYGMLVDWPQLKTVDVRGGINLTNDEIISLAALDDFSDAWAAAIPRNKIEKALESNPLIETATMSLTGLNSIRIRITERRPLAAIEHNGMYFTFDRSGEFIDIVNNSAIARNPVVEGVPLGLLTYDGVPMYEGGNAWDSAVGEVDTETMDIRFNRIMHLANLIKHGYAENEYTLEKIMLNNKGGIVAKYTNCPSFILGNLTNTELQYRRMSAMLNDGRYLDCEKISDIDLSSERFPCYHVYESELTGDELDAISQWEARSEDDEAEPADETAAETSPQDTNTEGEWIEPDDNEDEPIRDTSIFDLGSG